MPETVSFLQVVRERATEDPDRPAFQLVAEEGAVRLSFGALAERVQRLGTALTELVEPGDRVAICMENRPAWPVAYLSIWYAGGVIVPIDPALEPHAIRRVFRHADTGLCLTSHQLSAKIDEAREGMDGEPPRILDVDGGGHRRWDGDPEGEGVAAAAGEGLGDSWDRLAGHPGDAPDGGWKPRDRPEELATIMYTSGTTGTPKGVMLSGEALAVNIDAGLDRIDLGPDDHVLGVLPLFHVLPLMANCLGPIWVGARVTYLIELNPDRIIAAFPRYGITAFACVPLFFYKFHDRVEKGIDALTTPKRMIVRGLLRLNHFTRRRLSVNLGERFFGRIHAPFGENLRIFVTGGAKFDPDVYADFLDLGFTLIQGYGLTEATAILTAHPVDDLQADTVGTPVRGVEIRIDDPGEDGVGEILARTPAAMLGYYRNEEATEEFFDGDWLRTGDLGRLRDDGHLEVTGREKDVIVLASGKNIYPEELEQHYGQSELVEEICILGIEDPDRRGERLMAVVVPDVGAARRRGQTNIREMVKWELEELGMELPSPQRVTRLEIRTEPLPRTTTRKIKRFELREAVLEKDGEAAEVDAGPGATTAEDETERDYEDEIEDEPRWAADVREIVARHAGTDRVRRSDHLDLDLGLESLDRVELQADIAEAFGIQMPEGAGGGVQTVGDLLALVDEQLDEDRRAEEGDADRWGRVLEQSPSGVAEYLRQRRLGQLLLHAGLLLLRAFFRVFGLHVRGRERIPGDAPFIIAPNHFSYVDAFLLTATLPLRVTRKIFFVGYAGYFEGFLGDRAAKLFRTVPIDQNQNLERAMQAAAEGLRRQMILGIFPEGSRSGDGTVQEFRRGVGILSRHLQVPVVPVGMAGTYEMWPRKGRFRPGRAAVVYGEPLAPPEGEGREAEEEFVERLRERVLELVEEARDLREKS